MDPRRVIVPLDVADAGSALALAARLDPRACRVKVGKELFVAAGPAVVERLQERGHEVFLDLKFHDIPSTVAGACRAAARLGVWMVNVHASGGESMLRAAREAVASGARPPLLIGVTVLTSLSGEALARVGITAPVEAAVERLARLTQECGLDGVVCSALEAPGLRAALGRGFLLVTPGIRPRGPAGDDQARVATPEEAVRRGADYLVIGRPITGAADPAAALDSINQSLREISPA
jgi:orotidine-5'-phosphate decarboxylase